MNVVELKPSKLTNKINSIDLYLAQKYEEWEIHLNDEKQSGTFEKSDIRLWIECLDYNDIDTPELLLNGTRVGYIDNKDIKPLIHKLDDLVHH